MVSTCSEHFSTSIGINSFKVNRFLTSWGIQLLQSSRALSLGQLRASPAARVLVAVPSFKHCDCNSLQQRRYNMVYLLLYMYIFEQRHIEVIEELTNQQYINNKLSTSNYHWIRNTLLFDTFDTAAGTSHLWLDLSPQPSPSEGNNFLQERAEAKSLPAVVGWCSYCHLEPSPITTLLEVLLVIVVHKCCIYKYPCQSYKANSWYPPKIGQNWWHQLERMKKKWLALRSESSRQCRMCLLTHNDYVWIQFDTTAASTQNTHALCVSFSFSVWICNTVRSVIIHPNSNHPTLPKNSPSGSKNSGKDFTVSNWPAHNVRHAWNLSPGHITYK